MKKMQYKIRTGVLVLDNSNLNWINSKITISTVKKNIH